MSNETIKVVIAGPRGRMGQEAVKLAIRTPHFELVGAIDHTYDQQTLREVMSADSDALIYTDIRACFQQTKPDVLIDLTTPEIGKNIRKPLLNTASAPLWERPDFLKPI